MDFTNRNCCNNIPSNFTSPRLALKLLCRKFSALPENVIRSYWWPIRPATDRADPAQGHQGCHFSGCRTKIPQTGLQHQSLLALQNHLPFRVLFLEIGVPGVPGGPGGLTGAYVHPAVHVSARDVQRHLTSNPSSPTAATK